jgi:Asp-tRNA(Asn)/Glu-tRNA(Gln) amidotransferase A subunit family amidase
VGSDGGGSIRVPAHFSGICGLKPTPGRIPATGHYPISVGPFALLGVVGPMARTVHDLELMLEVMTGADDGDVSSAPVPFRQAHAEDLKRNIRIGFFEDDGLAPVTPETRDSVRRAAKGLLDRGFRVEPFRPEGLEEARQLWWTFFVRTGGRVINPLFDGRRSELSPILKEFLDEIAGAEPPLALDDFMNAWFNRDLCRMRLLEQMREFPVLLCPVCSIPAFRHREREWLVDGQRLAYLQVMRYTQWFNLTGNPGVVIPTGQSPEGLPIGVQLVGRPYEEELLLAVAAQLESACGNWRKPPC